MLPSSFQEWKKTADTQTPNLSRTREFHFWKKQQRVNDSARQRDPAEGQVAAKNPPKRVGGLAADLVLGQFSLKGFAVGMHALNQVLLFEPAVCHALDDPKIGYQYIPFAKALVACIDAVNK